ncbi:regulatory LuxR family protein [Antricoccus suffuscus]|uniref:Regulatory LuxR family protein n=1 Tax=Antricoccus suffuscus TaxID=1629062 RepID=A0A2T0ZYM9_9ACTN|nr:LuxR family transcriptional regulator [Antricoccus suffuscus]PRZ41455.1 regulatory LuxR family protein [Antricoccus suffuscus]
MTGSDGGPQIGRPAVGGPEELSRNEIDHRLREILLPVINGSSRAGASVALTGPAGIGKSYLASEFVDQARSSPAQVLTAVGDPARRRKSFAVINDLVGDPPRGEDPTEFVFTRVDSMCAGGPVLVWIDDVHQVDAASLRALRRLVWAAGNLPLAVLLAARTQPSREQVDVILQQTDLCIQVGPMDPKLIRTLVHSLVGRWPAANLMRAFDATGGNPLFIKELFRSLESRRALRPVGRDSLDLSDDAVSPTAELGPLVRDLLRQMDDESGLELLSALAVLATPASLADIADLMFTSVEALRPMLERLRRSGLVIGSSGSDTDLIGVSHDVYRDAAYELIDEPARRALHKRAAELLRASGSSPALVARHLLRAAAGADATADSAIEPALWEAARESTDFAPAVAAELLAEIPTYAAATDHAGTAVAQQARALFLSGQMRQAVDVVQAQLPATTDPRAQAELFRLLIQSQVDAAQTAAALRTIEGPLAAPDLPLETRHQLEQVHAWVRILNGDWQAAAADISASMPALVASDDRNAQAQALVSLSCAAHLDGRSLEASALIEQQFALQLDDEGRQAQTSALVWPPFFDLFARGVEPARQAVLDTRRRSQELGASWLSAYHCFVAAGIAFTAGDWNDALAEYTSGLELAEESGSGWISIAIGQVAYMDAHRGNIRAAQDRLRHFSSRRLPLQFGSDDPGWGALAALEASGDTEAAAVFARDLWAAAPAGGPIWMLQIAPDVCRVGLIGWAPGLCERVAEEISALDYSGSPAFAHSVDLVMGMSGGDVDLLETAATSATNYGFTTVAGYALEEAACAAATASQLQRARDRMEDALAIYDRMGAVTDRDRLLARTRSLGVRRGSRERHRPARTGPASLTATERRVAGLVREGLTNPEIGTRLYLSPRTVQVHVSHILGKLDLRSRVDVATAMASEALATDSL